MFRKLFCIVVIAPLFLWPFSCARPPKEYIERHGLHSDKKPSVIAKEIGDLSKGQKREYRKQLRKQRREKNRKNRRWGKGKKTYAE